MITKGALNMIRDSLYGDTVAPTINYIAFGDDNTAVTGVETQLVNETIRILILSRDKTIDFILDTVYDFLDSDGASTIREIGFFADGTASANSGTLISRILYTRDKTALETIQFTRRDTIGRG